MSKKTYEILKWIQRIVIPALITFYGVLGATLHIPATETVLTIAGAFDVMLGSILGVDSKKYFEDKEIVTVVGSQAEE